MSLHLTAPTPQPPPPAPVSTSLSPQFPKSSKKYRTAYQGGREGAQGMEEQGPQFSKPNLPANPGKTVSPEISNRTRLTHCTFIHILYFGIFQSRTGRDRVGQRLRREGEGGWLPISLTSLLAPPHGERTQRGRGGTEAPLEEEAAQSYTHATHTHTPTHTHAHTRTSPLHTGQAGSQRSRALWGQGQGSNSLLTDRRPAPPAPSDSIPKVSPEPPHPTLCLAILSWPLASSLLLGTK